MKWSLSFLVIFLFGTSDLVSQEITISPSQFVEYHRGSLPIVITVSSGGSIAPDSIPNRDCNNPDFNRKENVIEAAFAISHYLEELTGCYPHLIINNLHRKKVGCNRKKILGTCFQPIAEQVWEEYHQFVDSALIYSGQENNGNKFLIDLIGHDHQIHIIELGYVIPGIDLQSSNGILDLDDPINQTSIEHLIDDNFGNFGRSQLLRGELALGTLLTDKNFPAVPSDRFPFPFNSYEYLNGTYTTANYTNPDLDSGVIAIQVALNKEGLRDDIGKVQEFGAAFANSVVRFITAHRRHNISECGSDSDPDDLFNEFESNDLILFPNPAKIGTVELNLVGKDIEEKNYTVHNSIGQLVNSGKVEAYTVSISKELAAGLYFITTWKKDGTAQHVFKLALVNL